MPKRRRTGNHEELEVWQLAVEFGLHCYSIARALPSAERYGLAAQLTRASVSVAANIAEGYGRASKRDFLRFLSISRGSLCEAQTLFVFLERLGFCTPEQLASVREAGERVSKTMWGLRAATLRKLNG